MPTATSSSEPHAIGVDGTPLDTEEGAMSHYWHDMGAEVEASDGSSTPQSMEVANDKVLGTFSDEPTAPDGYRSFALRLGEALRGRQTEDGGEATTDELMTLPRRWISKACEIRAGG